MYAFGHLGLGYIVGKGTAKLLHCDANIYGLLLLSLLPDADLLLSPFLRHRGPTHSVVVAVTLTLPFLLAYGRRIIPYAVTLVTHSLVGDAITGSAQLLWPLSARRYGVLILRLVSIPTIALETVLFTTALLVLLKNDGLRELLAPFPALMRRLRDL